MPEVILQQNSFIGGLVSEEGLERSDKAAYYHSMMEADNVSVVAQGGIQRRPGTLFIGYLPRTMAPISTGISIAAPNGGDVTKLTNGNLFDYFSTSTAIGSTDGYVAFVCTITGGSYVECCDVYMVSLRSAGNVPPTSTDEFEIQYSDDGATWQRAKRMYLSSGDDDSYRGRIGQQVTNIRLVRVGTSNLGTYVLRCGGVRLYGAESGTYSPFRLGSLVCSVTMNYLLVFGNNQLNIYRNGAAICALPTPQILPSQLEQLKFSTFGESIIITHVDVPPLMVQRYRADAMWRIFPIVFPMVPRFESIIEKEPLRGSLSITPSDGGYVVSGDSDTFFSNDMGCMIYGHGGAARVIAYSSAKSVQVAVINKFSSYSSTKSSGWTIDRASLPLWGQEYGYPECSGFFANRLWLGGFRRSPRTLAGSVVGDYLNFDPGDNGDDDAILVSLSSGSMNHSIRYIFSSDNLEIFSDTGIFSLKKFDAGTQTELATAFYFRKPMGIEPYIAPFRVEDGGTLFVKRGRNDIRELSYNDSSYSYDARSLSLWSSGAVRGARSVCVVRSDDTNVTNHVYLVNGEGNIACITFLLSDNIHAATLWKTQGYFLACESTLQDAYVVTERNGDLILERVTTQAYLDSEVAYRDCEGGELSGLEHLIGRSVQIRGDNEYLGEQVVSPEGTIRIMDGWWSTVHCGLGFTVDVKTVPPETTFSSRGQRGQPLIGHWLNYTKAYISCYHTQEIVVDGYVPEFIGRTYSEENLTPLAHKSGRYRVFLGSAPALMATLHITQPRPLDFNIRGIAYGIDVD